MLSSSPTTRVSFHETKLHCTGRGMGWWVGDPAPHTRVHPWEKVKFGRIVRSQAGDHQAACPVRRSSTGSRMRRIRTASNRTATPRMMPISFGGSGWARAKVKNCHHHCGGGEDHPTGMREPVDVGNFGVAGAFVVFLGGGEQEHGLAVNGIGQNTWGGILKVTVDGADAFRQTQRGSGSGCWCVGGSDDVGTGGRVEHPDGDGGRHRRGGRARGASGRVRRREPQ